MKIIPEIKKKVTTATVVIELEDEREIQAFKNIIAMASLTVYHEYRGKHMNVELKMVNDIESALKQSL